MVLLLLATALLIPSLAAAADKAAYATGHAPGSPCHSEDLGEPAQGDHWSETRPLIEAERNLVHKLTDGWQSRTPDQLHSTAVGTNGPDLAVKAGDALYPVTVDSVTYNEVAKLRPDSSPGAFGNRGDWAGRAVSLDGNRALVGAPGRFDDESASNEEAFIFERDSASGEWQFVARLQPDNPDPTAQFGASVSLSGDRALIGTFRGGANGSGSGSAFVFEFDGTEWTQSAILAPGDASEYRLFGVAVSLSGDRALVGAPGQEQVFYFENNGATWEESQILQLSDSIAYSLFGVQVDLENDRALIGAPRENGAGIDSGAAYLFEFNGVEWSQTTKLLADDAEAYDLFGSSVSLSSDRALIGASHGIVANVRPGSAYLFEFDGIQWNESQKFLPPESFDSGQFGKTVALSESRALIGSRLNTSYVFDHDGTTWHHSHSLTLNDGSGQSSFGWAVDLDDDRALVGAPWAADHGEATGAAYVFDSIESKWARSATLVAPGDQARHDSFGQSVSLSGRRLLVGAPGDEENGPASGSAYLFHLNGNTWTKTAKLEPANGSSSDHFGDAVSLSNDTALIGAPGDTANGLWSGSAYLFRFDGETWNEIARLSPADGGEGDRFGQAVSLWGDRALIGAPSKNDSGFQSGAAYVFKREPSGWNEDSKLLPSDSYEGERFGHAVSLSGARALIGAPGIPGSTVNSGSSAYLFEAKGTEWRETKKLVPADLGLWDQFGHSVSLSENRALIGAPGNDQNGNMSGAAYLFVFDGFDWNESFQLSPEAGSAGDNFGTAVSLSGDRALISARFGGTFARAGAYVFQRDGSDWIETAQLMPGMDLPGTLGDTVDLSGSNAVIGAPLDGERGPNAGSVFVYMVSKVFSDSFEHQPPGSTTGQLELEESPPETEPPLSCHSNCPDS